MKVAVIGTGYVGLVTGTCLADKGHQVVFIAVGTPPGPNGEADLGYVRQAAQEIGRAMRSYKVIVNKSTVPVGTTDLVAGVIAEQSPYPFDVVSNPEFLREGAAEKDAMQPDRIVIGARSDRAAALMRELYRTFDAPIVVTDSRSPSMIKYAANAFLKAGIGFGGSCFPKDTQALVNMAHQVEYPLPVLEGAWASTHGSGPCWSNGWRPPSAAWKER